ncbi:MAG: DUF3592 domain-containing protein [Lachnospiraceae bacterium]|nr:DUF3592 domain-containing protein [Lachnospiraceae bacterium]
MSQDGILIFSGVVSILFMLVGIYGIQQKRKFSKKMQAMHKITGVVVDFDIVQHRSEENTMEDLYFPIYEYDWSGIKRRLKSNSSRQAEPSMGKTVHILVDPQTQDAICLEDEKSSQLVLLIFGAIGVVALVLVILVKAGVLS